MQAQQKFNELLKDSLAPFLAKQGFKGSGNSYTQPNDKYFVLIGFQKSDTSSKDSVKFTINVTVADKAKWNEARSSKSYLPETPSPNTLYENWMWQKRIGNLMPDNTDKWWLLTDGSKLESLANEVENSIEEYILPAIKQEIS